VAKDSQGVTVTWGSVTLGEVVSVSVDGIAADTLEVTSRGQASRAKAFSAGDVDYGTVTCTVRGTAGMSSTNVGLTAALSIGGPGVSWSFSKAVFSSLGWSATVGELQTFSVSFKVGA
jgi:hypothetical protein